MKSLILVIAMITTAAHASPQPSDKFICPYKDPSSMFAKDDYAKLLDNSENELNQRLEKRAFSAKAADGKNNK